MAGVGVEDWYDRIMALKTTMVLEALNEPTSLTLALLLRELERLQRWHCVTEPPLSTTRPTSAAPHSYVDHLWTWLQEHGLTIAGGSHWSTGRGKDRTIVSCVSTNKRDHAAAMCRATGKYWLSDLVEDDGRTLRAELRHIITAERIRGPMQKRLAALLNLLRETASIDMLDRALAPGLHLQDKTAYCLVIPNPSQEAGYTQEDEDVLPAHKVSARLGTTLLTLHSAGAPLLVFSDGSIISRTSRQEGRFAWFAGAKLNGKTTRDIWACGELVKEISSSTRAEAAGLLAAMHTLQGYWDGAVEHTVDNQAVMLLYARCTSFTAPDWLRQPDKDIWREICKAKKAWQGKYTVHWHRSHPERRAPQSTWSPEDHGVFDADHLVTTEQQTGTLSDATITGKERLPFVLKVNTREVNTNVPVFLRQHYLGRRIHRYVASKGAAGLDWASWNPSGAMQQQSSAWCRVQVAKMVWGWLATAKTIARREGHNEDTCPCCGQEQESNWHMFAMCRHPDLVQIRQHWVRSIGAVFCTALPPEACAAIGSLWRLEADGTVATWTFADHDPFPEADTTGEQTSRFQDAVNKAARLGPQRLWVGLLPQEWNDAVATTFQVSHKDSQRLSKQLANVCREYSAQMWAARNAVVHTATGNANGKERERIERAIGRELENSTDLPAGLRDEIPHWPLRRQKEWLRKRQAANLRRRLGSERQMRLTEGCLERSTSISKRPSLLRERRGHQQEGPLTNNAAENTATLQQSPPPAAAARDPAPGPSSLAMTTDANEGTAAHQRPAVCAPPETHAHTRLGLGVGLAVANPDSPALSAEAGVSRSTQQDARRPHRTTATVARNPPRQARGGGGRRQGNPDHKQRSILDFLPRRRDRNREGVG